VFRKATASEISARKAEKQRARPRPRPNRLQQPIPEMDSPDWHAPRCANCRFSADVPSVLFFDTDGISEAAHPKGLFLLDCCPYGSA
jgi:hypothetical protein